MGITLVVIVPLVGMEGENDFFLFALCGFSLRQAWPFEGCSGANFAGE